MPTPTLRRRAVPSLLILTPALALAQTAPTPPAAPTDSTPVELSPFVTTAGSEKGYVATSSLAGSRVNTALKDIAAQIDILTPEFLSDIAAINLEEAVAFSTNNGGPNEQNTGPNDGTASTRSSGRARGFDAITTSADFYATNLPSDLYNVERLTIANGPQSILFGLGNAGGAIDTSTKRALMRDRAELSLRTDNNDSLRTAFDVNRQLIPNKLALRLVALNSNLNNTVEGAYNDQQRLFGTTTWKLTRTTTLRLSGERTHQRASLSTNYISYDYLSPWIAAGRPLYDNSTGNASVTASFPLLNRNTNALRVVAYGGLGPLTTYVWNGSALTRGPHQLAGSPDSRANSLRDNFIYPTDRDPRVTGRINRLDGQLVRGAIEQRITPELFVEFGYNYESVSELRGGPFFQAETINIFADPNRYLPGGTAARPVTTVNPNAGRLYLETFPNGTELRNVTKEARLTTSYDFDFKRHFEKFAGQLGRHKFAFLVAKRIDEDRTQDSRASIIGNTSFTTADLQNNSRLLRVRYYLDPASGSYSAAGLPGGKDTMLGPWAFTDSTTGESFQASIFGNPAGRNSATGGSRKDIQTYMLALQSFFFKDRLNLFAGRRIDDFKSFLIAPRFLVRGDQLAPGDQRGLFTPLSQTTFDSTPAREARGITYSYGGVFHATRWLSIFASKSDNTALPPGFLDPDNRLLPGIFSNGYDYGFRVSAKDDAISLRVNFYQEHQFSLIGDGQAVRTAAAVVEQRLRGSDRPAGIATVAADGFDPVTRGDVYRSVEDKVGRGIDATLTGRLTSNWDVRWALGRQQTRVFNKSAEFNAWVARRLATWQQFGGLGWDRVTISATDPRTVHQYYTDEILSEITRSQLRNNLPRFRQREWRTSLFTNYRVSEGVLKGLNFGGGVRWSDHAMIGFVQRLYPDGNTGDDVTKPLFGKAQTSVDALLGYGGRMKLFGSRTLGWRVQLNVRNVLDDSTLDPIRARLDGAVLEVARTEPRQFILNTTFTF